MRPKGESLLEAINSPPRPHEQIYAYAERVQHVGPPDVGSARFKAVMIGIAAWGVVNYTSGFDLRLTLVCAALAALVTGYVLYFCVAYTREIRSLLPGLGDRVMLVDGQYFVESSGQARPAEFVGLRRGSLLVFDRSTGLNLWRLHLRVAGGDRYYDPNRMFFVLRDTPYPRDSSST